MKKPLLLTVFVLLISITLFCQVSTDKEKQDKSKLETFALRTGNLIKKEFIDVSEVKKVAVRVLRITDMLNNTTLSGIQLKTSVYKTYGSSEKSCFLDADEIESFIKSGRLLLSSLNAASDDYTEYIFTSRDGFQAGAYSSKKEFKYFLKLDKYDSDSYVFIEREDFQKIIDTIEGIKGKL